MYQTASKYVTTTHPGFGGRIPVGGGNTQVSHCFPVVPETYAYKVQGVLDAYRQSISWVGLSGPTLFSQVIGACAGLARNSVGLSQYTVLLILTDGVINDMQKVRLRMSRFS